MGADVAADRERGRARPGPPRSLWSRRGKRAVWAVAVLVGLTIATGVVYAGSPDRIARGVVVAGVDVGGLTVLEAETLLSERAAKMASVPVVFTSGPRRWPITPKQLDLRVDWGRALEEARAKGDGAVPLRGLKRVKVRLFGVELEPHAEVYEPALEFHLHRVARAVAKPARDASITLRGLEPVVHPSSTGRKLDRAAARNTIVAALAGFERAPVPLPVAEDRPAATTAELAPVAAQVRTALSAPVGFRYRGARWRIQPAELATLLALPRNGKSELEIGGAAADGYFARLARAVERKPKDADFAIADDGSVRVVPGADGRKLDERETARKLLAAAVSRRDREARLVVRKVEAGLTTREARRLRIKGVLGSYDTPYAGTYDRIRNLQLAVSLLDGTLIAPGATFSFNETVGPRTEERGFRSAPVIVAGEYKDGIGGGVSQVATTVFNAAWEAGVKITDRTAHSLYISRYPLGRDATVSYPSIDLRFVNDTGRWLVLRAAYGETGIAVSLLGTPTGRRVVSKAGELVQTARPRVKKILDPKLYEGEKIVEDEGEFARAVTVRRIVYEGDDVLYEETWTTTYRSEPKVVRVGTLTRPGERPPPVTEERTEPKKKKKDGERKPKPADTTTTPTTTTTTTRD